MAAPKFVRGARAAFVFLTRLPVGGFPYTREEWAWASAHFPLVGSVIGGMSATAYALLLARAGALGAAVVAVTTAVVASGAFHEDAMADSADALGGGRDGEHVLAILKDPRIGAYGAVSIVLSMLLRVSLMAAAASRAPLFLVAIHTAARAPAVWLLAALPYVTPEPSAKSSAVARTGAWQIAVATAWTVCILALTTRAIELAALLATALLVTIYCGRTFHRRVRGVTGDLLGSTVVFSECAMWLVVLLVS